MYIDIHCHLDLCKDIDGIVERAREKGIVIVSAGVDVESNRKMLEYSGKWDNVKACLGLYPIDALKMSDKGIIGEIEFIRKNKDKISAIGEVGLDFKESDEKSKQEENFVKFIQLAKEIDKPLVVHSRKAEERCLEILEKMMAKKVVMHCFCGNKNLIKRIVENGWFLSVPGNVVYSEQFRDMVKDAPIGSLLCETDSPFLHPERKRDNTPENVIFSYQNIVKIKNISLEKAKKTIFDNYKKLFI